MWPFRKRQPEPPPQRELPLLPDGWRIVGVQPSCVIYSVTRTIRPGQEAKGPFADFGGANATPFYGFPTGTLMINGCGVRTARTESGFMQFTEYKFAYRPDGWSNVPLCDFNGLPWGTE